MGLTSMHRLLAGAAMLAIAMLAVFASGAMAESGGRPGTLDTSFGQDGQVTSALPPAFLYGTFTHLAEGPNGELVLALVRGGGDYINPTPGFSIERRRADGSLDPSFGGDGSVDLPEAVTALAVDPSARVVYALHDRVYRLNQDGSLDQSCAGEIPRAGNLNLERLVVAADGEIAAAGTTAEGGGKSVQPVYGTTLARLAPDGSPDRGFGRGGAISLPAPGGSRVGGLATLESGPILLLAGGVVRRFGAAGGLDRRYGEDGELGRGDRFAPRAMLAGPNGELVLAGATVPVGGEPPTDYLLRRYTPTGAPDSDFGKSGTATVDYAEYDESVELAAGPDGGIVLLGNSRSTEGLDPLDQTPVLLRFDAGGSRIPDFGAGGALAVESPRRSSDLEPEPPSARAMVLGASGRIALSGTNGDATLAVRSYGGGLEPAFGAGASAILEVGTRPSTTTAADLVAETDGRLFVPVFTSSFRHNPVAAMLPFEGDGTQLESVGGELHYLPLPLPGTGASFPGDTVADGPEKLVSLAQPPGSCCYLSRFDLDGRPDPSFGAGGKALLPREFDAVGLLVGRDHWLTVFGHTEGIGMTIVRVTPDGHRSPRFGRNGVAHVRFANFWASVHTGLRVPRGKLLLAGSGGGHQRLVALARLLPDGKLDRSFGRDGVVLRRVGIGSTAKAVARQGRGFLVAGVRHSRGYESHAFVMRLGPDGHLDRSFGRDGFVEAHDINRPLAIFPTSGGFTFVGVPPGRGVVLRGFDRRGEVDRGFGDGGTTVAGNRQGPFRFRPAAAVQLPDGRIVVAGSLGNSTLVGARVQLFRFR
jgi:uncharacterized delta-60 repeat protein